MNLWVRNVVLLLLMLAASGLALALRPAEKMADRGPVLDLEMMIPRVFGDWHEEQKNSVQMVDPQQQELINKIYTQTLSRTYVDKKGYRIMLAIAYGDDQRDSMQIHYPEVCYPGQGFVLHEKQQVVMPTSGGSIPITRILTSLGHRNEPVTYWTIVGDTVFRGSLEKKLAEIKYGLKGKIPDGMLVRVSSIDADPKNAYEMQTQFANQMLGALAPEYRQKMNGNL